MNLRGHPTAFLPPAAALRPTTTRAVAIPPATGELTGPALRLSPSAQAVVTTSDLASAQTAFEPVAPDAALLAGMGSVALLCVAAGLVWANDVVPVSRTKLAISKTRGEVKEYLDGLRAPANATSVNDDTAVATMTTNEQCLDPTDAATAAENVTPNVGDGRDLERWLFSDWLNRPPGGGGRRKEPALPVLREAKWNSGDNPVLVTAAIMMLGIVLASITERISA